MSFVPISTTAERDGSVFRLYAAPRFVRPDGKLWRPIADAVTVRDLPGGGYRLEYGDRWVQLTGRRVADRKALGRATRQQRRQARRFGPLLDADKAPDGLDWQVTTSPGVTRARDAWILGEPDGVKLGLFLADWRHNFGDRCTVTGDRIALDLTAAKAHARRQPRPADRVIDLDPEISATGETGERYATSADWATARGVASTRTGCMIAQASHSEMSDYLCNRPRMQFDTSDLTGVVASATLTLFVVVADDDQGGSSLITQLIDSYATLAASPVDAVVQHTIDTTAVSALSDMADHVITLPAAHLADIDTGGLTCFACAHSRDVASPAPTFSSLNRVWMSDSPTLTVTLDLSGHDVYGPSSGSIDYTASPAYVPAGTNTVEIDGGLAS